MRVFVYEYLSSGAVEQAAAPSLQSEGWAMLSAVVEDFARCPGVETVTLLDARRDLTIRNWPTRLRFGALPSTEERTFRTLAAASDYALIIAPEFDDILERRCRWVEESACRLLAPSSTTVRFTGDKFSLACHFLAQGISTPLIFPSPTPLRPKPIFYPAVCKPRYGAGSQATFLVHDDEELLRAFLQAKDEGGYTDTIVQPYVPGLPVSVAFLAGTGQLISLPAVEQRLSTDGRFHYRGGRLPLTPELDRRARQLAERAARTVDGLQGWFGVDLVLGENEDGSGDVVIEINPRLTTSYVGLRRLARFNLAEAMLAVVTGLPLSAFRWHAGPIVFDVE